MHLGRLVARVAVASVALVGAAVLAAPGFDSALTVAAATPSDTATPPPPPPAVDESKVTVYTTQTGSKYHAAGCSHLKKSSIPMSLKDAKAKGLTPCLKCKP